MVKLTAHINNHYIIHTQYTSPNFITPNPSTLEIEKGRLDRFHAGLYYLVSFRLVLG